MTEGEPLDPRVVHVWRLGYLVRAALVAVGGAVFAALSDLGSVTLAAVLLFLALIAAAAFVPRLRYRSWSYSLREQDMILRRGVLIRSTSIVPFSRIQHVDTRRGPIERILGLATVVVYTAGSIGAALAIPGLDAARADALRDQLAELGATGEPV